MAVSSPMGVIDSVLAHWRLIQFPVPLPAPLEIGGWGYSGGVAESSALCSWLVSGFPGNQLPPLDDPKATSLT